MELPIAFRERMDRLLGEESQKLYDALEREQARGLRVNPLKADPAGFAEGAPFSLRPVPWAAEGYYYRGEDRPGLHPWYEAGVYYIQEPSAMAVGALADPQPGEWVLDLCAAPGGKTTHLAGRMAGQGLLVANEIHPGRAKILSQSVERAGITNCVVTNETPARLAARLAGCFDCIVVDAPCSGEGMFRKEEVAIEEWTPDAPARCAARQDEILDCAVEMLRPGGRLIYSTCTYAPEENEGTINRLLDRHPSFEIVEVRGDPAFRPGCPAWVPDGRPELRHTFHMYPHVLEGEGHFAAVLRRQGEEERTSPKQAPILSGRAIPAVWQTFEKESLRRTFGRLWLAGETLWSLPEEMPDLSGLRVLRTGLQLGECRKNRFEPAHALALALSPEQAARVCALSADQPETEAYLRGETLPVQLPDGWTLVTVDGYALGWGKVTGGVLKNHYPKGLRRKK